MRRIYPSVLLGLGEAGADIASRVHDQIRSEGEDALGAVHRTLRLTASGWDPAHATLRDLPPLSGEITPGAWAENHDALRNHAGALLDPIEHAVREIRSVHRDADIEAGGAEIAGRVHIHIVTALSDPVGSAALIPLLEKIQELFEVDFLGMSHRVEVLLLSPNLLPLSDPETRQLAGARSYACLQEIEAALESGSARADLLWLLSHLSEDDRFVESYHDLAPILAHHLSRVLGGYLLQDTSFAVALSQEIEHSSARYSAFGASRLVFPRTEIVSAATAGAIGSIIHQMPALGPSQRQPEDLYGETQEFLRSQKLESTWERLRERADGGDVWISFHPPLPPTEKSAPHAIFEHIEKYADRYAAESAPEMIATLGERRSMLAREWQDAVRERIHHILDQEHQGSIDAADSWLAALEGDFHAAPIPAEIGTRVRTLEVAAEESRRYFDRLLVPKLFDEDPDVPDHLPTERRALLLQIEQDIPSKQRLLKRLQAEQEELQPVAEFEPETTPTDHTETETETEEAPEPEEPGGRYGAVGATISTLEEEIKALKTLHRRIQGEVTQLDLAASDPAGRRSLWSTRDESAIQAITSAKESYESKALDYRDRRLAAATASERRRDTWIMVVAALLLATVLTAGAWAYFDTLPRFERETWQWLAAIALAIGLAVGILKGELPLRRRLAEARAARYEMEDALAGLINAHSTRWRSWLEHQIAGAALDLHDGLIRIVESLRKNLRSFATDVLAVGRQSRQNAVLPEPPRDPFTEHLVPAGGVDTLLESRQQDISDCASSFWRRHLSHDFAAYTSFPGKAIRTLHDEAAVRAQDLFRDIARMSVEEFFCHAGGTEDMQASRAGRLLKAASPLAKTVDFGGAWETRQSLLFLGTPAARQESHIQEALGRHVSSTRAYTHPDETTATLHRLTFAFTAFQFSALTQARRDWERIDAGTRPMLYTEPDRGADLPDLLPSRIRMGSAIEEPRKLACLSLVYDIAHVDGDDGERKPVRFDGSRFGDYAQWVAHLSSRDGRSATTRLRVEVDARRNRRDQYPQVLERVRSLQKDGILDPVDREIIEDEVKRIAPRG